MIFIIIIYYDFQHEDVVKPDGAAPPRQKQPRYIIPPPPTTLFLTSPASIHSPCSNYCTFVLLPQEAYIHLLKMNTPVVLINILSLTISDYMYIIL